MNNPDNFHDLLAVMRDGKFLIEFERLFRDALHSAQAAGKPSSLTIRLHITKTKGDDTTFAIEDKITLYRPPIVVGPARSKIHRLADDQLIVGALGQLDLAIDQDPPE